jgi:hypothetical protein
MNSILVTAAKNYTLRYLPRVVALPRLVKRIKKNQLSKIKIQFKKRKGKKRKKEHNKSTNRTKEAHQKRKISFYASSLETITAIGIIIGFKIEKIKQRMLRSGARKTRHH